jgi:hypothetical protein
MLQTKVWKKEGSAAAEFALLIPLFAILVTGAVELGYTLYQAKRVYDAAEAGILYASQNGFNASGISSAITTSTGIPGMAASPAPSQFCGCPGASGITAVSCSSSCACGDPPGKYISIGVLLTRQSIIAASGLGLPSTLSASAIVRTN